MEEGGGGGGFSQTDRVGQPPSPLALGDRATMTFQPGTQAALVRRLRGALWDLNR